MAITRDEFEFVAGKVVREADWKLRKMISKSTGRRKQQLQYVYLHGGWIFSLDKATYHTAADLDSIGISSEDIVWLASASGDMHGIIEHPWGYLDRLVGDYMMEHPEVTDMNKMMQRIRELWDTSMTPQRVQRDFKKQVKVWQAVRAAGGDRVDRKLT